MSEKLADLGLVGLAVMGSNLALNIESRGYKVAVYNRTGSVTDKFIQENAKKNFLAAASLEGLIGLLARPRKIFIMVQAGDPTDHVVNALSPLLQKGDLIIDGGNAFFKDTMRREAALREAGIYFIGLGVSGGEEGALKGPSLMAGGDEEAWRMIREVLEKIAAYVQMPCVAHLGPNGAGHFVKMTHNGIEYADMQLIAETYHLLKKIGGFQNRDLAETFERWNEGELSSYLIEITARIFRKLDDQGREGYLVDYILDQAGQKGTGRWTVQSALDLGVSIPTIAAAVDARAISANRLGRLAMAEIYQNNFAVDRQPLLAPPPNLVELVRSALYCAKIISYAQGFALLREASERYSWKMNFADVANVWRGGCIIRAKFLSDIARAFADKPDLKDLLLDLAMIDRLRGLIESLRQIVALGAIYKIPLPAMSASLAYFESRASAWLPHNLLQAQRDLFGAHTYKRIDREGVFHSNWDSK
ncbi:MAG TPA: NADP-dependent phosphogluconate dehydrogenase [Oligoflexia bacterium]|nr:NADP-dependent phosphogluconate dehydrogenase [Oligoflexia bacterium]HMP27061.1 NADP-dependent phosphogluconate dehydrogenase [Oligoflexia bacterium]